MSLINKTLLFSLIASAASLSLGSAQDTTALQDFRTPPSSAKPGVYWFFMDANLTKSGMAADLEAMNSAGLGRALFFEAALGGPQGDVPYMSPEWLEHWRFAAEKANELGVDLSMSVGPGWCGAGGPWIKPENTMQHLRASFTQVEGGQSVETSLEVPTPRDPYFGQGTLGPSYDDWRNFYRDVAVLAFPTPKEDRKLPDWEEKALFYRPPYSSMPGVKPYLLSCADDEDTVATLADSVVAYDSIIDITDKMDADGVLRWDAPEGNWTIARLGRRITGQTTRPAPQAALGLESDKFEKSGIEKHFESFNSKLIDIGRFTTLHHDSWEMSSQNWSEHFREMFIEKRGYDPLRWTPAMFGIPVESVEQTERFLWDLRRTAQELVYENNVVRMKELAAERGLNFSTEVYDLNPAGDLYLFRAADIPMCEFWAKGYGFETSFSVVEATSTAHTTGKKIVGAESFTTMDDRWRQHPGIMKRQADWAFCAGVNSLIFHRMCAQPGEDAPGFSLGPHGTHFDRTETWFPLVGDFCQFVARSQALLQRGTSSADVLYLDREGAPQVFVAPSTAFMPGEFQDKREYNFDGCCPQVLIDTARAENGKIVFPDGATYSLLVLPNVSEMTIELATKLQELIKAGVPVIGAIPEKTPTLVDYPAADAQLAQIARSVREADADAATKVKPIQNPRKVLTSAKWIWSEPNYNALANVSKTFVKKFELPADFDAQDAYVVATADNVYTLTINGVNVATGNNFHSPDVTAVPEGALHEGVNEIRFEVLNEGVETNVANPAGGIASLYISDALKVVTDASWENEDGSAVAVLGAYDMAPWNITIASQIDTDATYPQWDVVQKRMAQLGIAPEFESTGDVRWIRRVDGDVDIFYIGNRLEEAQNVECTFRVSGKRAQLWDPITGKRYAIDTAREEDGRTIVPIAFEDSQSFFVIFQPEADQTLPLASDFFAPKRSVVVADLSRNWSVSFDQNAPANRDFEEGRPKTVQFDALTDWSKSDDAYLRYYSGLGVYEKTFDPDAPIDGDASYALEFDSVEVMARVELNGVVLGTAWHAPWRVEVPAELLRDKGNELKITVANLWCNRLIGDASRPAEERFTRTSNPMWGPGDEQLLPSGLIGDCALVRRVKK